MHKNHSEGERSVTDVLGQILTFTRCEDLASFRQQFYDDFSLEGDARLPYERGGQSDYIVAIHSLSDEDWKILYNWLVEKQASGEMPYALGIHDLRNYLQTLCFLASRATFRDESKRFLLDKYCVLR